MLVKCSCKHCGGRIEFESEHAGTWVDCPHCQVQTPLKLPAQAPPIPPTWREVEQPRQHYPDHVPNPKKRPPLPKLAFIAIPVGIAIMALFAFVLSQASPNSESVESPEAKSRNTVDAGFTYTDTTLLVNNKGASDWFGLTIFINGTPPGGYRLEGISVKAGDLKAIPLNSFAKKSGERFNPFAYKVTEIWIGGNGYNYEGYGTK